VASLTTTPVSNAVEPENRFARLRKLPPFNNTAVKLLSLTSEEESSAREIEDLFRSDPALAGELLVAANSPLFGFHGRVSTLRHAIVVLGRERIRTLVMTIATASYLRGGYSPAAVRPIWAHAVATALIAQHLSRHRDAGSSSFIYTAGLTHDLGRLGLLARARQVYEPVLTNEFATMEESCEFEKQLVGLTHTEAGAFLAQAWGFPKNLCACAADHHSPEGASSEEGRVVQTACSLAAALGFPEVRLQGADAAADAAIDEQLDTAFREDLEKRIQQFTV